MMDQHLYHITPSRNVSSIRTHGIIPAHNNGGITVSTGRKYDCVFLTNDVERILRDQCGKGWLQSNPVSVIKIDVSGLDVARYKYVFSGTYTLSDFEFVTGTVSPDKIVEVTEVTEEVLVLYDI